MKHELQIIVSLIAELLLFNYIIINIEILIKLKK